LEKFILPTGVDAPLLLSVLIVLSRSTEVGKLRRVLTNFNTAHLLVCKSLANWRNEKIE
jgi:hypothetical protein